MKYLTSFHKCDAAAVALRQLWPLSSGCLSHSTTTGWFSSSSTSNDRLFVFSSSTFVKSTRTSFPTADVRSLCRMLSAVGISVRPPTSSRSGCSHETETRQSYWQCGRKMSIDPRRSFTCICGSRRAPVVGSTSSITRFDCPRLCTTLFSACSTKPSPRSRYSRPFTNAGYSVSVTPGTNLAPTPFICSSESTTAASMPSCDGRQRASWRVDVILPKRSSTSISAPKPFSSTAARICCRNCAIAVSGAVERPSTAIACPRPAVSCATCASARRADCADSFVRESDDSMLPSKLPPPLLLPPFAILACGRLDISAYPSCFVSTKRSKK